MYSMIIIYKNILKKNHIIQQEKIFVIKISFQIIIYNSNNYYLDKVNNITIKILMTNNHPYFIIQMKVTMKQMGHI